MTLDGWSSKTIGELCNFSNGYGFRPPDWSKEGLPIIRIQNLNGSKEFNYFNGIPDGSWLVEPGTILFAWAGMPGISFGPTIWNGPRGVLNQHIYRIHPHKGINPLWLYAALEIATKNIEQNAHGFKATLLHVRKEEITSQVVHFPPLCEQQKIVTVLSDIDTLIESLDKLIAKKRDIKQATMQQLLTGKTRLPGFSGEWKVKKLDSLLKFQVGFPFSSMFFNQKDNGIRLIKNRDLKSDDQIYYYNGEYSPVYLVADGDVLIGMDGDFIPCLWRKGPALLNQRVGRILTSLDIDRTFAYYFLIKPLKVIEIATSSTTVKHLSHRDIEDIEMPIPHIDEQTAIAAILSDMDAEIAALEQKRDKTRALKQGMMQELLTGKTRLL